jgi:aspartyl-tRNA(Asn)/glutamyl-tRNA(Gln) amidotransferase subunit A
MIADLARTLRRRETTSIELVNTALARIEETNPRLNAFISITADQARRRAIELDRELQAGSDRGPLHGIPIALKDLIHLGGVRTTAGSPLFADWVPDESAEVVLRLEKAGAVIVGKTGLHELAYGVTSNNPHFGPVRNPRDPARTPGGSSGGSGAAVAAGIVPVALGTDTGGSIRIPASFCGCVGLKATYGRVSKRGVLPLGFSLDHIGPLAASVDDAAITLNAIAGRDPLDPTTSRRPVEDYRPGAVTDLRGIRIGRPANFYFERLAPGVAARTEHALRTAVRLGADVISLPVGDVEEWNATARVILLAEATAALEPHLHRRESFGADVLALLDQGRLLPATMYVQAQRLRSRMVREVQKLWARVDCLFAPTTPTAAPLIGASEIDVGGVKEDVRLATTRLVRAVNLLGLPALSLPNGSDEAGMPVGLQIIAPPFAEARLLQVGAALEAVLAAGL